MSTEWTDAERLAAEALIREHAVAGERDQMAETLRLRSEALNRVVAENERLRAKVARVEAVLRDISDPNPEADQDWHDDPIGCVADDLRAALADRSESS